MAFAINPPNAPLVDLGTGRVDPTWYRFFAQLQRALGDDQIGEIVQSSVLTYQASEVFTNERVLTGGTGLSLAINPSNAEMDLDDTAVAPGTYGSATQLASYTVDQQGRITFGAEFELNTTNITEGSKLFYTDTRARLALSAGVGINYNSGTGLISTSVITSSGIYTPTVSAQTNLDALTVTAFQWMRVGDTVTVSGRIEADPTLAATATSFKLTLPIPSNLTIAGNLAGTVAAGGVNQSGYVLADTVNDLALVNFLSTFTGNAEMGLHFTYQLI